LQKSVNPGSQVKADTPQTVRIAAVGDIMLHSPQIKAGLRPDGSYDFRPFFKEVKLYLSSADLAVGNLETTLGGPGHSYSGYPRFNSPDSLVDAVKDAGFDLVSTANNHAMDTGEQGVIRTYQVITQKGLKPFGTAPSADLQKPVLVNKNSITFAFLAYTQMTNGIPVPKPYLVNRINLPQIQKDIAAARKAGAEFVCVYLHFGIEYQREPNDYQVKTAHQVLEAGADVVFGDHPHVLQPLERVKVNGKEKLIIYSLGNFVSNQTDPYTDEGVILYVDVVKDPAKHETTLKNISFLPTFVLHYPSGGKTQLVVIPIETKNLSTLPKYPGISMVKLQTVFTHTEQKLQEKTVIPTFSLKEGQSTTHRLPQEKKPISRILSRSPFFKKQMNPVDGECLKK
jgi:poly-gamma-glutamate synthesis protein (capsule biosynthesis protein)